jgi:hypothetical protein
MYAWSAAVLLLLLVPLILWLMRVRLPTYGRRERRDPQPTQRSRPDHHGQADRRGTEASAGRVRLGAGGCCGPQRMHSGGSKYGLLNVFPRMDLILNVSP